MFTVGRVVKTGISGGKIAKNGKSYRATRQVNAWNKKMGRRYDSRIVHREPAAPRRELHQADEARPNVPDLPNLYPVSEDWNCQGRFLFIHARGAQVRCHGLRLYR